MRIALITLALVALIFIGSIVYSLAGKGTLSFLPRTTTSVLSNATPMDIETLKYQIKTEEKLAQLEKKMDALILSTPSTIAPQASGSTSTGTTPVILSGKFLAKIMPTFTPVLDKNTGVFGLHNFDSSIPYSTYVDTKNTMQVMAFSGKYDTLLRSMKTVSPDIYTINQKPVFPFRSFYVNPPKPDTLVRIVIEVEGQPIAIEIPKIRFPQLQTLLLKK